MHAANLMVVLHVAAAWQVFAMVSAAATAAARSPAACWSARAACSCPPPGLTTALCIATAPPLSPLPPPPPLPHTHTHHTHARTHPTPKTPSQPIFEAAETGIRRRLRHPPRPWLLRLLFRSTYVAAVTLLACLLPFFGDLMGLISSIGLMPGQGGGPEMIWLRLWRDQPMPVAADPPAAPRHAPPPPS